MKASDYIVEFLCQKSITDVFGYPGGMVTHLMDSFYRYREQIAAHVSYHEQSAAFSACGYAQASGRPGVAYATSGPGATNLITGIANAYFDSIPTIFITGQVNTYESKGDLPVRQKGFQEMDIVSAVSPITKFARRITRAEELQNTLEKAYALCLEGRSGPVLLDIPMNIFRAEIAPETAQPASKAAASSGADAALSCIRDRLAAAKRPLVLAGAGIAASGTAQAFRRFIAKSGLPVVTSMIGVDCLPADCPDKLGFIGAYGHRCANFAVTKCDLLLSFGSRLDCRQTGSKPELFAPQADLIRVEIDPDEAANKIKPDETVLLSDLRELMPAMADADWSFLAGRLPKWKETLRKLREALAGKDSSPPNELIHQISSLICDGTVITTDVGQNQVWVSQSFAVKPNQRILFSGGHAAMGYALPAAVGAYYASGKPVVCFTGDGGLQMNIQELQYLFREQIPVKIIVVNNHALGMIRHFQEMYFDSVFAQTIAGEGFSSPDFCKVANAYGIAAHRIDSADALGRYRDELADSRPVLFELSCAYPTYVYPKLAVNRPISDQEPLLDRELYDRLLCEDF